MFIYSIYMYKNVIKTSSSLTAYLSISRVNNLKCFINVYLYTLLRVKECKIQSNVIHPRIIMIPEK